MFPFQRDCFFFHCLPASSGEERCQGSPASLGFFDDSDIPGSTRKSTRENKENIFVHSRTAVATPAFPGFSKQLYPKHTKRGGTYKIAIKTPARTVVSEFSLPLNQNIHTWCCFRTKTSSKSPGVKGNEPSSCNRSSFGESLTFGLASQWISGFLSDRSAIFFQK